MWTKGAFNEYESVYLNIRVYLPATMRASVATVGTVITKVSDKPSALNRDGSSLQTLLNSNKWIYSVRYFIKRQLKCVTYH